MAESNNVSLKSASQGLLSPMAEHWMSPTWLDDLLSDTAVDIDSSLFDLEFKGSDDSEFTYSEPLQPSAICVDISATAMQQGNSVPSAFDANKTETKSPVVAIQRAKPPIQPANSRQSVRCDKARRMEIAQLKLEVPRLEACIESLMQNAVSQSDDNSSLHKCQLVNDKLRELTRLQQLRIARGLSVASHMSPQSSATLLNYSIRLPREIPDRVNILRDLSAGILRDGRETLRERMRFLNCRLLPCNEISSSATAEGDMCTSVFAATPIQGATNIKQVLDALRSVLVSEMDFVCQKTRARSMTEAVDVHPNLDESGIAHRLCMRWSPTGVVTEFNGVLFSEYQAGTDCKGQLDNEAQATIAIHSVEDDKLHPYTAGRMRLDVTSVFSIHHQQYSQGHDSSSSHHSSEMAEGIVVVRSAFIKLYRGGVSISASDLRKEMDIAVSKGPAALKSAIALLSGQ